MGRQVIDILIADNHTVVRRGLRELFNSYTQNKIEFNVAGEATTGDETLKACIEYKPHIILTEITTRCKSGFDVLQELNRSKSRSRVIFYTTYQNAYLVHKSRMCGAYGYVLKNENEESLINTVLNVAQNRKVFPDISTHEQFLPQDKFFTGFEYNEIRGILTSRELEVFKNFGRGCCINDTAEMLSLCRKSIEYHQGNIKYKLMLKNQYEMVKIAARFNLLDEL